MHIEPTDELMQSGRMNSINRDMKMWNNLKRAAFVVALLAGTSAMAYAQSSSGTGTGGTSGGSQSMGTGGTSAGGEVQIATVANVLSFVDLSVARRTTYYYKIRAVNGFGLVSPYSNEVSLNSR